MAISDEHRELISRLVPVDVPAVPCEDCIPSVDGKTVEHSETCPVSIDIERITAADREWFENHPGSEFYYRPVTWGEGAQLLTHDERVRSLPDHVRLTAAGKVRVEQIEPGVRGRRFDEVFFVIDG